MEHTPVTIDEFLGLWNRGQDYSCPLNHFLTARNIKFSKNGFRTRDGTYSVVTRTNIRRIKLYRRAGESDRFLILDDSGNLYDSVDPFVPILTVSGMTDFSFQSFGGRAYISPHNGNTGLSGEVLYVYLGSGTARPAAGSKPNSSVGASTSGTTGNVEAGTHLFAVCYETNSNFITKPSNSTVYVAPGGHKVTISQIPIGPTGTIRRRIVATKSTQTYSGDPLAYEYFFVPDGIIDDNFTTQKDIDFFDSQLLDSADYLFDILEEISAGTFVSQYAGRLVVGGADGEESVVRLSKRNDPETFDAVEGFVVADPTEPGTVKNGTEFRNTFYIFKSIRCYVTSDDFQNEPIYWELVTVDKGAGTEPHGISTLLDAKGTATDRFFVADRSGLLLFDGYFHRPELTWKIQDDWKRITKTSFDEIEVHSDSINQVLYIIVPLDGATTSTHIFFGDYSEGLDAENIKWSVWDFPYNPVSASVSTDANSNPVLNIGSYTEDIYRMSSIYTSDGSTAIPTPTVKTSIVGIPDNAGVILHSAFIRSKVRGSGILKTKLYDSDGTTVINVPDETLESNPAGELMQKVNQFNEGVIVEFSHENIDEYFEFNRIRVFQKPLWIARPA